MWKMLPVQSVIAWGRFYGFCKRHYRRICTLLHAQKSTRKAPATFEAREARIKGCSPLIIPKQLGSIQKIQVAALEDFCVPPILKPLSRYGGSSPQESGFACLTLVLSAAYRRDPSREKADQKSPQAFLICRCKNIFSAIIAKANAAAIPNRCCSVYTSHPPCARMKPTNQRR